MFAAAYVITRALYPAYANYFPLIGLVFLLDLYLWFSIRKRITEIHPIATYALASVYWLPFIIMLLMTALSFFHPVDAWARGWHTWLMGFVVIVYVSKLFAIIFLLMADLVKIIRHTVSFAGQKRRRTVLPAKKKISRSKFIQNIGLLGGGIILSGMIIGMVRWAYEFRIKQVSLPLKNLAVPFRNLKIVHISDLHLGSWTSQSAMEEAIRMINNLGPDLVVFTGDLVNFTTKEAIPFKDALSRIKAPYGTYAILGNHDYGDYIEWPSDGSKEKNFQDLLDLYKDIGWTLLRNSTRTITIEGKRLAITGVENWSMISRFHRYGNLKKAMNTQEEADLHILLSHDPTHFEYRVQQKRPDIAVTLSGHTHGFQFGLEFKSFRWSPAQYMYRYWAGLYSFATVDNFQHLYVNRGLGNIGYPGRIGILPEITLLTLRDHPG